MTSQLKFVCAAAALSFAGSALATTSWTLNASGNAAAGSNSAATATSISYANTSGSSGSVDSYTLQTQTNGTNVFLYSGGIGINNRDGCNPSTTTCATDRDLADVQSAAPEHAIDNDQRYEMVLVSFSTKVSLTSVTSGWTGNDADITVVGYSGSAAPTFTNNWATSVNVSNGWTFLQNSTALAHNIPDSSTTTTTAPITTSLYSSYWLIGAFNPLVSTNAGGNAVGLVGDNTADYFKLLRLTGCVQGATGSAATDCGPGSGGSGGGSVPEPTTLLLLAAGALGIAVTRRRL